MRSKSDAILSSHRPVFLGLKAKRFDLLTSTAKALHSAFGNKNDQQKRNHKHLEHMTMVDHKTDTLSLGGGGGSKGRKDRRDRRPSKNTPAPSNSGGGNRVDLTEVKQ